jgi:hypothetical protein
VERQRWNATDRENIVTAHPDFNRIQDSIPLPLPPPGTFSLKAHVTLPI